jgi:hypothetical protein
MAKKTDSGASPSKRLIMMATDKGGVGKSFFCVQLMEWLARHPLKPGFAGFDPDHENKTLLRFHPDHTRFINVDMPDSIDICVSSLQEGNDISVVDGLGAQQKKTFQGWVDDVRLFEVTDQLDLRITYVLLIEEDPDVINQSRRMMDLVGDQVDWLVVRNLVRGPFTDLWESSTARKVARELNATEIEFIRVPDKVAKYCQGKNLPLATAAEEGDLWLLDKNRIETAWSHLSGELGRAESILLPPSF